MISAELNIFIHVRDFRRINLSNAACQTPIYENNDPKEGKNTITQTRARIFFPHLIYNPFDYKDFVSLVYKPTHKEQKRQGYGLTNDNPPYDFNSSIMACFLAPSASARGFTITKDSI